MAAKRAGEPSPYESAKKMPKLTNEQASNVNGASQSELLWTAIVSGRQDTAADLVRSGIDFSVRKYDDNRTILHEVLRSRKLPRKEELVRLMLDHGADVNARDSKGRSLLHEAIKWNHCSAQVVELLLDHGAQVTINEECLDLDDLCWACENKPELLLRLIEHQVPDEETRNRRGIIAVNCLISESYSGDGLADAVRIMEILDLGVPVDGTSSFYQGFLGVQCKRTPLQLALWCKKKEAIKLLLERGANPHLIDAFDNTSLYQAMKFKTSTHVSRWLIEKGVSIHARSKEGATPLHGACSNESLKNLHLLINLGADLRVTDDHEQTPFRMLRMTEKSNNVTRLVIKHLALIVAKGGKMVDSDLAKICTYEWSEMYFEECKEQLERMKGEKIWKNVSYFSLFTRDMYSMIQLVRNANFVESFEQDEKRRVDLFPEFSNMILQCFELAEKRLRMLVAEKNQLHEVFERAMPDHIVENIAYHSSFEKLERCRQDYYMSFHAKLKNTKADKAKIL